jgi:hypothetical protein
MIRSIKLIFPPTQDIKAVMEGAEMDAPGDRGGWKDESPSDMEFKVQHAEVKVVCLSYGCRRTALFIFA